MSKEKQCKCLAKQIIDLEAKLAELNKERRKAYQDSFFQKQFEKDVEIVQLKQQLAESEKEKKYYEIKNDKLGTDLCNAEDICSYLQQQLAESEERLKAKENVNQMYKATLNLKDIDFSDLVRENAQLKQQLEDKNQNKISFAVEQLEKVKSLIENADNNNEIYIRVNDYEIIDEIFDNQIKQLKEGK